MFSHISPPRFSQVFLVMTFTQYNFIRNNEKMKRDRADRRKRQAEEDEGTTDASVGRGLELGGSAGPKCFPENFPNYFPHDLPHYFRNISPSTPLSKSPTTS